jgi:DNA-binding transcriptional MerR regulator
MNGFLQIGEVAAQTGLTADAIRFYEREQLLHESHVRAEAFGYSPSPTLRISLLFAMRRISGFRCRRFASCWT